MIKKMLGKYKMSRTEDIQDNKGFTLVELIVVLVILAILAAILVPALLGYIDKAKGQQLIINGKNALNAAQTVAIEGYAKGEKTVRDYLIDHTNYRPIKKAMKVADTPAPSGFIFGMAAEGDYTAQNKAAKADSHDAWTVKRIIYWEGICERSTPVAYFDGNEWHTDMTYREAIQELYNKGEFYRATKDASGNIGAYSMWTLNDSIFTDITMP